MSGRSKALAKGFFGLMLTACATASCRGPLPPMAVSPLCHGGSPNRHGPSPIGPLWRANALSAPVPHGPCCAEKVRSGVRCTIVRTPSDPYAAALAEAAE